MKLSTEFRSLCELWRAFHTGHAYLARQFAVQKLVSRYGGAIVIRHTKQIKAALDRIEETVKA